MNFNSKEDLTLFAIKVLHIFYSTEYIYEILHLEITFWDQYSQKKLVDWTIILSTFKRCHYRKYLSKTWQFCNFVWFFCIFSAMYNVSPRFGIERPTTTPPEVGPFTYILDDCFQQERGELIYAKIQSFFYKSDIFLVE